MQERDNVAKSNNQIWRNGTFWKIILIVVGAAVGYGALTFQVKETAKKTDQNTLDIVEEAQRRDAQNLETRQDVRELQTDIRYIRQSVDEIKIQIQKIPVQ